MFIVTNPYYKNEIKVSFTKKGKLRARIYWNETNEYYYFRFGKNHKWYCTNSASGTNYDIVSEDSSIGQILYQLIDKLESTNLLQEAFHP